MTKITIKGLLAHKLRFVLTALAVMLGVAFMSGTLVLTDTISKTFDDLFANVYEGTDAVVRSRESIDVDFGGQEQRSRVSGDLVQEVEGVDGVRSADRVPRSSTRRWSTGTATPSARPSMGAPTLRLQLGRQRTS